MGARRRAAHATRSQSITATAVVCQVAATELVEITAAIDATTRRSSSSSSVVIFVVIGTLCDEEEFNSPLSRLV